MNAFAAAAATLSADANLSVLATLRPAVGPQVEVRVIRSSPIEVDGLARREAASIARAALAAAPQRHDELVIGQDIFVVEAVELDPEGTAWTLTLSR